MPDPVSDDPVVGGRMAAVMVMDPRQGWFGKKARGEEDRSAQGGSPEDKFPIGEPPSRHTCTCSSRIFERLAQNAVKTGHLQPSARKSPYESGIYVRLTI